MRTRYILWYTLFAVADNCTDLSRELEQRLWWKRQWCSKFLDFTVIACVMFTKAIRDVECVPVACIPWTNANQKQRLRVPI